MSAQRAQRAERMRGPELRHPSEIWDLVMNLYSGASEMAQEYEDAFHYAFDDPDRPTDEQQLRVATSGTSDRVGTVALSQHGLRKTLVKRADRIERYVEKSVQIAGTIEASIRRLFRTVGDEEEYQPLSAYRLQSEKESADFASAKAQRDKRRMVAEANRLRRQLERLERDIRRADA